MKIALALILAVGVAISAALPQASEPSTDIQGAQVFRVVVESLEALEQMVELQRTTLLDFWTEPRSLGFVDIMARRPEIDMLKNALQKMKLNYKIQIPDVGKLVAEQKLDNEEAQANSKGSMDWTSYHTYDTIESWMVEVAASHPDIASIREVGRSYEGRSMKMLKLSTGGVGKQAVFSDGGIHAREWIAPATVTYFIDQMVNGNDEGILDSVDFYFMPSINPDGYSYSFTNERMWRKTRSPNQGSFCVGTDPNRNWDFHWMEAGASSNPCAGDYGGSEPFSEVEMQAVRDVLLEIKPRVYLTFHSFSQYWMYPWGWTADLPDNWRDLDALAQDAVAALTAVRGTRYEIGSSTNVIYIAAGGSDDWAMGVGGSEYAYTIELPDQGRYGFLLPRDQIIPVGQETYEAFKAVGKFVASLGKKDV